uniref:Muscular LMNA interacting protein n=1 Tax=Hucho hucho TaxID=62062 RepID=A0A4W5R7N1_9TELE
METAVNKQQGISQQLCHNTTVGAEVSSGHFLNIASDSDERLGPNISPDLFATSASSKSQSQDSILSDSWDKDRSWSALQMSSETSPVFCSRVVSPCSSVRSGMFTPSVVQVKRHSLEPGSSLVHMPPTCLSSSCCECPSLFPCPLSPRSRRRSPPMRLSLLTAILRKGRLPVLSSSLTLQSPYFPCWPIHHGTSCNACSAGSSLASTPLEVSSSKAQSSASVHSPAHRDGFVLESPRYATAPPSIESKELSTSWRMVGRHSPPLRHVDELKSNNGITFVRVTSHSYGSLVSPPVLPLSQPFTQNLPKPVDFAKVPLPKIPNPPLYSSHSRPRYWSPEPLNNSVKSRFTSLSPEPNPAHNQGTSASQPLYTRFSKLRFSSPEPVNTSSNSTLDSLSAEPKPLNNNFVQALHSHLNSKLSFLSFASANNQETFKALVTSTPEVSSMGTSNNRGTYMGSLNNWGTSSPQVASPLSYSSLSRLDAMSPKPSSLSYCASGGHLSAPSHSPSGTVSSAQRHTDAISPTPLQDGLKTHTHSRLHRSISPANRSFCLTTTLYTPAGCPSPEPPTPPSTPDHFILSPSPASPTRDLTRSHSLSLRSTPCPWSEMSDSNDKKRKPHKFSYKALAAIPTNTLLLDQQVCSPAQLRQQSEDLYAVIDEVLEDPIPMRKTSPALAYPRESKEKGAPKATYNLQPSATVERDPPDPYKRYTSLPSSLGRETKYATYNLQPSATIEREPPDPYKTKPGVIRPANIIPRLPEEDNEAFHPNPFKQYLNELSVNDQNKFYSGC